MGSSPNEPERPHYRLRSNILLVEDNYIIALDMADMLRELGVMTVRTAHSVLEALDMIAVEPPGFGFLDVNIGADKSFQIAQRLRDLGIPFAFSTGYNDGRAFPAEFSATPIIVKPYTIDGLRSVISAS